MAASHLHKVEVEATLCKLGVYCLTCHHWKLTETVVEVK